MGGNYFHFMKYFPIWNNITYGMSSFSLPHNGRGMGQLSCQPVGYCDICTDYRLTAPWRYLCDCDPLGAFGRQRWLRSLMRAEECHHPVKLNIPTFKPPPGEFTVLASAIRDDGCYPQSSSRIAVLISLTQCCSLHPGHCSMQQSLCYCADCRDYQSQHCKWANNGA